LASCSWPGDVEFWPADGLAHIRIRKRESAGKIQIRFIVRDILLLHSTAARYN
jgi:hypothetical protein